jgi:hypothetical protein
MQRLKIILSTIEDRFCWCGEAFNYMIAQTGIELYYQQYCAIER